MRREVIIVALLILIAASACSAEEFPVKYSAVYNWTIIDYNALNEYTGMRSSIYNLSITTKDNTAIIHVNASLVPPKKSAYYDINNLKLPPVKDYPPDMVKIARVYAKYADSIYELESNIAFFVSEYMSYNDSYIDKEETLNEIWANRQGVCRQYSLLEHAMLHADGVESLYAKGIISTLGIGHMALFVVDNGTAVDGTPVSQLDYSEPTAFLPVTFQEMFLSVELWLNVNSTYETSIPLIGEPENLTLVMLNMTNVTAYYTPVNLNINGQTFKGVMSSYGGVIVANYNIFKRVQAEVGNVDILPDIGVYYDYYPANTIVVVDKSVDVIEDTYTDSNQINVTATLHKSDDGIVLESKYPVALLDKNMRMIRFKKIGENKFLYLTNASVVYLPTGRPIALEQNYRVDYNYTVEYLFPAMDGGYLYVINITSDNLDYVLSSISDIVEFELLDNRTAIVVINVPSLNYTYSVAGKKIVLSPDAVSGQIDVYSITLKNGVASILMKINPMYVDYFIRYSLAEVNGVPVVVDTTYAGNGILRISFDIQYIVSLDRQNTIVYGKVMDMFSSVASEIVSKTYYADYRDGKFTYSINVKVHFENLTFDKDTLLAIASDETVRVINKNTIEFTKVVTSTTPMKTISTTVNIFGSIRTVTISLGQVEVSVSSITLDDYTINAKNNTVTAVFTVVPSNTEHYSARYVARYITTLGTVTVSGVQAKIVKAIYITSSAIKIFVSMPLDEIVKTNNITIFGKTIYPKHKIYTQKYYKNVSVIVTGFPAIGNVASNVPYTITFTSSSTILNFKINSVFSTIIVKIGDKEVKIKPEPPQINVVFESKDTVNEIPAPDKIYAGYKNVLVELSSPADSTFTVYINSIKLGEFRNNAVFKLPSLATGNYTMLVYDGDILVFKYSFEVVKPPLSVVAMRYYYYAIAITALITGVILYAVVSSREEPVVKILREYPDLMIVQYVRKKNKTYVVAKSKVDGSEYIFKFVNGKLVAKVRRR